MNRALYNGVRGLVGSLVVFPVAERLEGRDMRSKQRQLAAEMSQPFAERRRRSWNRLVDLVRFSAQKVPYYRDLFATTGFDPESLTRDAKYLADIPYLTKDIIRAEGERLLRDDHMVFRKHVTKSGGSTGPSVHVIYDQEGADWSSAVTRYARAQIGAGASRLQLHLAARFPDRFPARDRMREQMKCLANNRLNVTFASFAPDDLDHIWTRIKAIRPFMVHGHPSTMYQLALHVADRGEGRNAFRVFESSGEMLDDRQRRTVEAVFGCTVIDRYGHAEAGVEDAEILLNRRHHRQARLRLQVDKRFLQQGPRAPEPRRAVELDDVGGDHVERCRRAGAGRAKPRAKVRDQPQIPCRSPRIGIGNRVEGRDRQVGRHPADTGPGDLLEPALDNRPSTRDRAQIGRDHVHQSFWRSHASFPRASMREMTVSVSVTQQ